jgi:hypothetical protein
MEYYMSEYRNFKNVVMYSEGALSKIQPFSRLSCLMISTFYQVPPGK